MYRIASLVLLVLTHVYSLPVSTEHKTAKLDTTPLPAAVNIWDSISTSQFQCMKNDGIQTAIVLVSYKNEWQGNCIQVLSNAKAAGLATEVYMVISDQEKTQAYQQFDYVYNTLKQNGITFQRMWTEITHPEKKMWNSNHGKNIQTIQAFVDRAAVYGIQIGILTGASVWNSITGDTTQFKNLSLWYQLDNTPAESPTDFSDFKSFGGWDKPVMKLFSWGEEFCGVNINRDVYDPSLNFTPLPSAIDVSYPVSIDQFKCLKNDNYKAVFVRAAYYSNQSTYFDNNAIQTINNAYAANLPMEVSMHLASASNVAINTQFQNVYDTLRSAGIRINRIWAQVHDPKMWSGNQSANVAAIQSFVGRAAQFGVQVGIYTDHDNWGIITGSYTGFSGNVLLWYSTVLQSTAPNQETSDDFSDYRTIGGWFKAYVKQFSIGESVCGLTSISRDVYDPSLILGQNNMVINNIVDDKKSIE